MKLPWTGLDMSAIRDSEALTGSPRVYTNAKPGLIMEAFSKAGSSNLVFIINELDKDAISVLMNAIYFKGIWTNKFDKKDTKKENMEEAARRRTDHDSFVHRGCQCSGQCSSGPVIYGEAPLL